MYKVSIIGLYLCRKLDSHIRRSYPFDATRRMRAAYFLKADTNNNTDTRLQTKNYRFMKQFLLISAAMALAAGTVCAQNPVRVSAAARAQKAVTVKDVPQQVLDSRTLSGNVKMQTVKSGDMVYKRIVGLEGNRVIQPLRVARAEAGSGYVLNEDFEGCTGEGWMPEGWQALSKDATTQSPWIIDEASSIMLMGAQGSYLAICNFNSNFIDEWLITPTVHVEEGMVLRYLIDREPLWMYSTDNVDWSTYSYIGEKTQV